MVNINLDEAFQRYVAKVFLPWHVKPSPSYPGKHEQKKLPIVLVQWANTSQGRYLHSFSSITAMVDIIWNDSTIYGAI